VTGISLSGGGSLRLGLGLGLGRRDRGRRWCRSGSRLLGLVVSDKLNVVAGEEAAFAPGVGTHPPILIHHLNVGDNVALYQFDLVVLGLLVVVLNHSPVAALSLLSWLNSGLRSRRRSALRLRLRLRLGARLTIESTSGSSGSNASNSSYSNTRSRTTSEAGGGGDFLVISKF
jgi:hypothetical protein